MTGTTSRIRTVSGKWAAATLSWLMIQGGWLFAQTVEELESDLNVSRGMSGVTRAVEEGGEPVLNLFTVLILAGILVVVGFFFLGSQRAGRWQSSPASDEDENAGESYFLNVAFLVTGYIAVIFMLAYLPSAMTPGLGTTTRWVLVVAAIVISIAHLLAARDEQALPPVLKAIFSGGIILAAFFFHLSFQKWSFFQFSDPFYHGKGPYVVLGLMLLLVLVYSVYIAFQHFKKTEE